VVTCGAVEQEECGGRSRTDTEGEKSLKSIRDKEIELKL